MQKRKIFLIFAVVILVLCAEIAFLNLKNSAKKGEKDKFINLVGFADFGFNNGYLRHLFSSDINEIYGISPGLRESKLETFVNSGLDKIYE